MAVTKEVEVIDEDSSSVDSQNPHIRKIKPSFKGNLALNNVKLHKDECALMVAKHFKEERIDLEKEGTVTKKHLIDMVKKRWGLVMTGL